MTEQNEKPQQNQTVEIFFFFLLSFPSSENNFLFFFFSFLFSFLSVLLLSSSAKRFSVKDDYGVACIYSERENTEKESSFASSFRTHVHVGRENIESRTQPKNSVENINISREKLNLWIGVCDNIFLLSR